MSEENFHSPSLPKDNSPTNFSQNPLNSKKSKHKKAKKAKSDKPEKIHIEYPKIPIKEVRYNSKNKESILVDHSSK